MDNNNFEKAEQLFEAREFDQAFSFYRDVTQDAEERKETKVEALNMMGVIISSFAPDLDIESDNGIEYFRKAVELDPECLGCLLNIVNTFGEYVHGHGDRELFKQAYFALTGPLKDRLTTQEYNTTVLVGLKYGIDPVA